MLHPSYWPWLSACLLASVIGIMLLVRGLRRLSSLPSRCCPRCHYDLTGIDASLCPECGRARKSDAELIPPTRRWRSAVAGTLFLLVAGAMVGWVCLQIGEERPRRTRKITLIHALEIRQMGWLEEPGDLGIGAPPFVEIRSRGKVLWRVEEHFVGLGGNGHYDSNDPPVGLGEDITGDAVPNLVISTHSGGNRCCATDYVFAIETHPERGPSPRLLDVIPRAGYWTDLDHDGLPEHVLHDPTFAYWMTSGAGSPYPRIVLRWSRRGERYVVAADLMKTPAPAPEALEEMASSLVTPPESESPIWERRVGQLFHEILDLIYSGNAESAWRLLDMAYPSDLEPSAAQFRRDLEEILSQSPWHTEVLGLQADGAPDGG